MIANKQVEIYEKLFENILATTKKKRADYSGDEDVLSNFKGVSAAAKALGINVQNPEQYAMFMVVLKIARLTNLLNSGKTPENEGIEDSYLDAINYFILSYCCYKENHLTLDAIDESASLPAIYDNTSGEIHVKTAFELDQDTQDLIKIC